MEQILWPVVAGGLATIGVATGAYGIFAERFARRTSVALEAAEFEVVRLREMIADSNLKGATAQAALRRKVMDVDGDRLDLEIRLKSAEDRLELANVQLDAARKAMADLQKAFDDQTEQDILNQKDYFNLEVHSQKLERLVKERALFQRPKSKWFARVVHIVDYRGVVLADDKRLTGDNFIEFPELK